MFCLCVESIKCYVSLYVISVSRVLTEEFEHFQYLNELSWNYISILYLGYSMVTLLHRNCNVDTLHYPPTVPTTLQVTD